MICRNINQINISSPRTDGRGRLPRRRAGAIANATAVEASPLLIQVRILRNAGGRALDAPLYPLRGGDFARLSEIDNFRLTWCDRSGTVGLVL